MDNGDTRFPSSRSLRVPFVFVPKGSPPPLEWMAAHPNYVTIPAVFIPRPRPEPDMGLEPQPKSEGQAAPLAEKPTYEVEIDYAGNWIIKGVTVMMPRPAPQTEHPSAQPQEARPPGPILDPQPKERRPDYLRCVPPPEPRRARGGPPPLGPNPAARGMDPLSPEFTRNLVRKTARIMAGMDRVMRPGGIATDEGLSAAVHAGMQHVAAHKGDVRAALSSAKAAGTAVHKSEAASPRKTAPAANEITGYAADGISILTPDKSTKLVPQSQFRDMLPEASEGSHPKLLQITEVSESGDDGGDNRDGESSSSATSADNPVVYAESRALYELYKLYEEAKRLFGFSKLPREPSPALADNPYNPDAVEARIRPRYVRSDAHVPGRGLTSRKDKEPADAESVYQEGWLVRQNLGTWWGRGELGYYRYFFGNDGTVHFTGIFPRNKVPTFILEQMEE